MKIKTTIELENFTEDEVGEIFSREFRRSAEPDIKILTTIVNALQRIYFAEKYELPDSKLVVEAYRFMKHPEEITVMADLFAMKKADASPGKTE